jgi:hypothetical protein
VAREHGVGSVRLRPAAAPGPVVRGMAIQDGAQMLRTGDQYPRAKPRPRRPVPIQHVHASARASMPSECQTVCRRVMTSHQLHMRRDSACVQQRTDVARIAGQYYVRWSDQQRYVRIDDISRASPREQLAYLLAVIPVQCFGSHTRQYSCEIGLLAAITPDLTDNRGTRTQRRPLLLEHAQLSTHLPVTPVDGDQRSSIEYRLHATSGRGARPSRDAAATSSASVKEPSSDSQASKAAPSSSFLSLSAAASLSQADTLIPCRSAALRTPSPRSGGIVTENLSTCAMHTIISHTLILNSASTAAHLAVAHLVQQSARLVTAAPRLSRPVIAGMYMNVRGDSPLGHIAIMT